jgi:hypothetical protein
MINSNPLTSLEAQVLEIVRERYGGNEITGGQLSVKLGVRDRDGKTGANMRSVINTLRDKGRVVCANSRGYYYPRNVEELADYVDQFQNRINEQQRACDIMKERVEQWFKINIAKNEKDKKAEQGRLFIPGRTIY